MQTIVLDFLWEVMTVKHVPCLLENDGLVEQTVHKVERLLLTNEVRAGFGWRFLLMF